MINFFLLIVSSNLHTYYFQLASILSITHRVIFHFKKERLPPKLFDLPNKPIISTTIDQVSKNPYDSLWKAIKHYHDILLNCYLSFNNLKQMFEVCKEHQNKIERICLHLECEHRALCLLCDHPHGTEFRSIMVKQSESYKKFQAVINAAIDKYFLDKQESEEERLRMEQIKLTKAYFMDLRVQFQKFLQEMETKVMEKLNASEEESFNEIKKARINKNYVQVPQHVFKILFQVYEGMDVADIFQNNQRANTEEAFQYMNEFHTNISHLMQSRHFRMKVKIPDLRNVKVESKVSNHNETWTNYDAEEVKKKFEVKLVKQSACQIDTVISDCITVDRLLYTTSYDKKLRIFDRSFNLKFENQYNNILTKVCCIGDETYSLAHSKEILIEKVKQEKDSFSAENIMRLKGHTERINDMHFLNTRILGSSSSEGVKIWDLYKQKCEYTLKEQGNPTAIRFMPSSNSLIVGYNNHLIKIYSIQTMKLIKKYEVPGVPLMLDEGKNTLSKFYAGTFKSNLFIFDLRMAKAANQYILNSDAVTCIADSIFDESAVAVGDRAGVANLIDLRTRKIRVSWSAHNAKTHLSKPRGIVNIFQEAENEWITVGCNDRSLKLWEISRLE